MEIYGAYGDGVARIREAVLENQLQMRQVEQSLLEFQSGLLGVEREMLPVYKLTEQLRGTQKNIDLSVQELRQINENFVAAHELAPVLLNGAKFDQDEYVKALQKLLIAITFLEGHRSYEGSVKALDQAKELLVQVRRKCMADFASVVSVLSQGEQSNYGALVWAEPSKHDVSRAAQLLDCLLISSANQTELLREYGKQRFDVIKMFIGDDPSSSSLGFDLNNPVTALAKCLQDIDATIEAEKTLAGLIFPNEELANTAFRCSAYCVLDSWKKDIDVSLRSPNQIDAIKLLLVHDLLLARVEVLETARFNDQLEELHKTQRAYVVAEVPIRQYLIRTAVDTVVPAYKTFYEKYSAIQFSKKHANRYLKYTPQAVQALLKELFSGEGVSGDKQPLNV
ncbi:hypothetical protein BBJ29_002506 [Phytophthora kernoviae]|uniref:Exocyst complex subunit Exo70 C-terminal domain-containing protein n=1 Tax=Phytophthora kernoviae TaxID=325452 RepID=A0A3F2RPA3_9STRA|nr:hypothetical protein BBJ29_002506 [Phytophthora kernoviae]RLN61587.1 hypothetical protein BBP00_00005296 [Phytophthora kernoviae]